MSKKILVIDDDHLVVKSLSRLIEGAGYMVDTAESGQEALGVISRNDFNLIILDIRMPNMDGVETAQKIKEFLKENSKKEIPMIFITGYSDDRAYENAKKINASDFIYKPFDKDLFLKSIATAMEGK